MWVSFVLEEEEEEKAQRIEVAIQRALVIQRNPQPPAPVRGN